MSLAYSRKQRRHRSRPYLRIRPRTEWQTRLRWGQWTAVVGEEKYVGTLMSAQGCIKKSRE
eukprot:3239631-Pleurochrysis_carterae.AAC.1